MAVDDGCWQRELLRAQVSLVDDEVHVWQAALDLAGTPLARLQQMLSPDEHNRAARFHFERDRVRFVVGRGVLRALLGAYVNAPPESLRFSYGSYGKPALADHPGLQFNVSHSAGLALYAVARRRAVGVDIEHVREDILCNAIAAQFFSPAEQAALALLPPAQQPSAFFHCWTRKEAYIKACGTGLSLPLDQFDVTLTPGEPARLLSTRHNSADAAGWSMENLNPAAGYVAALVVQGRGWHATFREYVHA